MAGAEIAGCAIGWKNEDAPPAAALKRRGKGAGGLETGEAAAAEGRAAGPPERASACAYSKSSWLSITGADGFDRRGSDKEKDS